MPITDTDFNVRLSRADNGPLIMYVSYSDGSQSFTHSMNVFEPDKALENIDSFMKQYNDWLNICIKNML